MNANQIHNIPGLRVNFHLLRGSGIDSRGAGNAQASRDQGGNYVKYSRVAAERGEVRICTAEESEVSPAVRKKAGTEGGAAATAKRHLPDGL